MQAEAVVVDVPQAQGETCHGGGAEGARGGCREGAQFQKADAA